MKIGLFGGSFNPVHLGHVNIAEYAFKKLKLDKLIFIPCYQSVDKNLSDYADAQHRVKMLEKILIPDSFISLFEINQKKAIESFETVKYFKSVFPNEKLFFIIGEDNLSGIERWENILEIAKLSQIVVFRRFFQKQKLDLKINLNLLWMENNIWKYSSKDFREKRKNILDKKVEDYIKINKLYNFSNHK